MQPLISVIIPVYNRKNVLEECVNSVLNQTWNNLEVLLIDDGSTDGSKELSEFLAKRDSRIRVLQIPHSGVSVARNVGLDAATGEYLFFVDSDDVIDRRLLEALCLGMERHNAGIGGSDIVNVSEKNWYRVTERMESDRSTGDVECHTWETALHTCFREQTPMNQIGGVMIRTALAGQTRFREDLFIGEDFWYIYKNLLKGGQVLFLKPKWYYCRHHAGNSSWNYSYDGFWTRFYRRQLVWEQEEKLGRQDNAALQKRQAYGIFLNYQKMNHWHSEDNIRMRKVIRPYTAELFPALLWSERVKYIIALNLPWLASLLFRMKRIMKW